VRNILDAVNTTAMVLGYILLALFLGVAFWILSARIDVWRYNRKRARQHDVEWDRVRSQWIFDQDRQHRTDTVEAAVVYQQDVVDTDVIQHTVEQIYTYQKEHSEHP
jgi:hypothetical protein